MRSLEVVTLGPPSLAAVHEAELPQKNEFCGAFWGCLALRAFGILDRDGEPVDQDLVARESGTTLAGGDADDELLPPGEVSRVDYRLELPVADDPATCGTAAPPLARAVEHISGGELIAVPVAGPWTEDTVTTLVERAAEAAPDAVLIANLRTGRLATTRPMPSMLLAHLGGDAVEFPPSEWDEGHFVSVHLVVRGHGGVLLGIRDTYRSLGWNGNHLQPPAAVAAALRRDDGREGGVLCVCRARAADGLRDVLQDAGFTIADWDNGTVAV
jgi:hypothetical protein